VGLDSHWDEVYTGGVTKVSWFQEDPAVSLRLIAELGAPRNAPIIDVGGGASTLVDRLLDRGYTDVSVLDLSDVALSEARGRLAGCTGATWICADLLTWHPPRRYEVWHDRAVLHFLVDRSSRDRYFEVLRSALAPTGWAVIGAFAADGPDHCSGLPVCRYSADDLRAALGPEFDDFATCREVHVTPRGSRQPFTWVRARRRAPVS
jgi:hypothetical protein